MRICFFNRSYYPDRGATGQLLTELAEGLVAEHGFRVTVVAGRPLGVTAPVPRAETRNGVRILRASGTTFGPRRFLARATNYVTYFLSACRQALGAPRADVVVALTDPPIIGLAALLAARRGGARFVFLCQDVFPEVARLLEDFRSETVNALLERVNRFLVARADRVIALGETMRARLISGKGAAPEKVRVIHNWADTTRIVPGPKSNPFSEAHGLADKFVVMHSGNLGLSQGLEHLLGAAERLRGRRDLVFAIVGDGVKLADLEARARALGLENVHFFPHQPKDGLHDSFASADAFVISLKRGLAGYIVPSKLYGILAAGRPYVAAVEPESEVAVITEKYYCGLVARPEDAEDLADKIAILHRDRDGARAMGESARRASAEFDRKKQVAAYAGVFRELAEDEVEVETPVLKRAFDVALSGIGLLVSAPLWALIAIAVRLEDGGPVFYAQERVGRGGRSFRGYKFRSMVPDADRTFGPIQASENDPRVTRVGRLLRATAMDELPQLWNIFAGDMSFVGPRALASKEVELKGPGEVVALEDVPGYAARHRVTPGLTGLAQVYAPRDVPRRQKFRYDSLYAERRCFWLDLKLIALSFWITFRGKWEHRGQKL